MTTSDGSAWAVAVAAQLRAELAASPLTAKTLADLIKIDRVTLSRYLNGHRDIPVSVFLDIVRELNVEAAQVISDAKRRLDNGKRDSGVDV